MLLFLNLLENGISFKKPQISLVKVIWWINHKPLGGQKVMLDEWEVCSYVINPHPLVVFLRWYLWREGIIVYELTSHPYIKT